MLILIVVASIAMLAASPLFVAAVIMTYMPSAWHDNPLAVALDFGTLCMPLVGLFGVILAPVTMWRFSGKAFKFLIIIFSSWLLFMLMMLAVLFPFLR